MKRDEGLDALYPPLIYDELLGLSYNPRVREIMDNLTPLEITNGLSRYARNRLNNRKGI